MSEALTEVWLGVVEFYTLAWEWVGSWAVLFGIGVALFATGVMVHEIRETRRRSRG